MLLSNPTTTVLPKSLPGTDGSKPSVPLIAAAPVAFPADIPAAREAPYPQSDKQTMSNLSPTISYQRTLSSPSSPSRIPGITSRSPLGSPGRAAGTQALSLVSSKVPSSLTRNSSVPASLSHNTRPSYIPTRSTSVSHSRPSLSSPSPPTPVVPSIPLRHATQHSPAQPSSSSVVNSMAPISYTPHSAPTTYSRVSLDRQPPLKKQFSGYSPSAPSFATASDPNLPAGSASIVPYELSQYTLPLKQLLSKPASPLHPHSGSESEGTSQPPFGLHHRSASTSDSAQYAAPARDSDVSTIEFGAVRPFQRRPLTVLRPTSHKQGGGDGYHYQRTMSVGIKKGQGAQNQGRGDALGFLSDSGVKTIKSTGDRDRNGAAERRPRNVLKRRPSATSKVPNRSDPTPPSSPRLSRSFSASSLLRRSGFLSARPSMGHAESPLPRSSIPPLLSGAPTPSRGVGPGDLQRRNNLTPTSLNSHVEDISIPLQFIDQIADRASHTGKIHDVATHIIPTTFSAPSQVSKQPSSSPVSVISAPLSPIHVDQAMSPGSTTTSSGGFAAKSQKSRDKWLSPAGAVADAYKREQLVRETSKRYSTPYRPPRPSSPHLPPTVGDPNYEYQSYEPSIGLKAIPKSRPGNNGQGYLDTTAGAGITTKKLSAADRQTRRTPGGPHLPVPDTGESFVITDVMDRFPSGTSPHPSETRSFSRRTSCSPPLTPPPARITSNNPPTRNRLKKARHTSDQSDASATPYYTVVGTRTDQVFGVGGPRDSFGVDYAMLDKPGRKVLTTITVGGTSTEGEMGAEKLTRSLSRKLSGKFKSRTGEGNDESGDKPRGRLVWKDNEALARQARSSFSKDRPEKPSDDRCLPYLYSTKKQAKSETDLPERERPGAMFPKIRRFFGRSKSKERIGEDYKADDPPPLPALPKRYASPPSDNHPPVYSRRDQVQDPSPRTRKSPRSSKSNGPSFGRPSTATRSSTSDVPSPKFWQSARSSTSSLDDVPPMPNPLPNLTRYATMDDSDSRSLKSKIAGPDSLPRIHTDPEDYQTGSVTDRSDSPPIPLFSTADVINSFPLRRSSDPPTRSPISSSALSPVSPPPRPARSSQRPKIAPMSSSSFGDEALYPAVMKGPTRSIPKMTFREMDSERRPYLSEQEKADRWDALLQKSDAAGGTLHFGAGNDKLPSDELRFSRTLSELALDDK